MSYYLLKQIESLKDARIKLLKEEEDIFIEIQKFQLGIESHTLNHSISLYDVDECYIPGKYYVIIEKNLYKRKNNGALEVIKSKSDYKISDSNNGLKIKES